jgi:excisionase family DNA binding protein
VLLTMIPRTLTLDEAAAMLKTTPETVSDCVHNRGLPAARIGRAFVLVEADVIEWVRQQYGAWKDRPCGSTNAANEESGGRTLARLPGTALDAALAPRTTQRRKSGQPRLRQVSGAPAASEKLPA